MQKLRRPAGFSLIELMVVVAIIGILSAYMAPALRAYGTRESARSNAQNIAAVLADARARAISQGTNHLVIFSNPVVFADPLAPTVPVAQVVQDVDADWALSAADVVENAFAAQDSKPAVTPYGLGASSPFSTSPPAGEDFGINRPADLSGLANGTSFPTFGGAAAIGFTPRGIPVDLNTPGTPGSGAGTFYVTDNNKTVYAVALLPLGGVRVRVLDSSTNTWL